MKILTVNGIEHDITAQKDGPVQDCVAPLINLIRDYFASNCSYSSIRLKTVCMM